MEIPKDYRAQAGDLVVITADYPNQEGVKGKTGVIREAGRRGLFEFAIKVPGFSYDLLFDRHEFEVTKTHRQLHLEKLNHKS